MTTKTIKIGLREIRSLGAGDIIWDTTVKGFGARRQKGDAVSYVLFYRTKEGRQRWFTIGRHGAPWTPDMAREKARELLGDVSKGLDPATEKGEARKAPTVADLCDKYWKDAEAGRLLTRRKIPKKASTLISDKGRIERHIRPLLGKMKVAAVTQNDIEAFMHKVAEGKTACKIKGEKKHALSNVRGGKGAASRTVGLLGAIFAYAIKLGLRLDNPVHGVIRYADGKRQRRLSEDEFNALGTALRKAELNDVWPPALCAVRLLALTGWRSGEVLNLKWKEIDFAHRTATLEDTKTGLSIRPLSMAACDVLKGIKMRDGNDLVFPASRGRGTMVGFPKFWAKIAKMGELNTDITPHVLRHSFASLAADLGYSEPTIAALVGHKGHSITSRYIHSADMVLLAAADVIANKVGEMMGAFHYSADILPMRQRGRK